MRYALISILGFMVGAAAIHFATASVEAKKPVAQSIPGDIRLDGVVREIDTEEEFLIIEIPSQYTTSGTVLVKTHYNEDTVWKGFIEHVEDGVLGKEEPLLIRPELKPGLRVSAFSNINRETRKIDAPVIHLYIYEKT